MSPRPKNIRKVNDMPAAAGFKPIGLNGCCKNTIFLHFEEYEAIRLCDYEMKTQQEASVSMGVSRPTLSRIYTSARQKIAQALVRGVVIMIEGGVAYTDSEWFRCGVCGLVFNNINPTLKIRKMECPICHSNDISISNININKNEIMMKNPRLRLLEYHAPRIPCHDRGRCVPRQPLHNHSRRLPSRLAR